VVSTKAIRQGIYTKLNVAAVTTQLGNGSASLVHGMGGPKAVYPLCAFSQASGVTRHTLSAVATDSQLWLVKAITRDTSASATPPSASIAENIDAACDDALDQETLTLTGGTCLYVAREGAVNFTEVEGDQVFHHVGAYYRVIVTP